MFSPRLAGWTARKPTLYRLPTGIFIKPFGDKNTLEDTLLADHSGGALRDAVGAAFVV